VSPLLWTIVGAGLLAIGLYGVLVRPHLVQKVLAFNVMTSGVFLLLVGRAERSGGAPDPVPQAMVLTGIVVAVSATAVALALVRRIEAVRGAASLPEEDA
jgi:multicomponent Na+:H+ antiporter subunit C